MIMPVVYHTVSFLPYNGGQVIDNSQISNDNENSYYRLMTKFVLSVAKDTYRLTNSVVR